jgi:hypothetical protein
MLLPHLAHLATQGGQESGAHERLTADPCDDRGSAVAALSNGGASRCHHVKLAYTSMLAAIQCNILQIWVQPPWNIERMWR